MKKRGNWLCLLALLLSHAACFAAGWGYQKMFCAGEHMGTSAPAWLGLLDGLPFALGALLCVGVAWWYGRKSL